MEILKPYANAADDQIALPVVKAAGIACSFVELEVARIVGALDVPVLAEVISDTTAQIVAMVQNRIGQYDFGQRRAFETRSKFRLPLYFDKSAPVRTKLVFEDQGQLEEFHIVAIQNLIVERSRWHINFSDFGVDADREIMSSENDAAVHREFFGVHGIGRKTHFATTHDARAAIFFRSFNHGNFAVNVDGCARNRG